MPLLYEEVLAFILAQLPEPAQRHEEDGVLILGGEPCEVLVRLTGFDVLVAEYAPTPIPIGSVCWAAMPEDAAMRAIKALLTGAREARRSKYVTCSVCGELTAPEWMRDDVCGRCSGPAGNSVH